MEPKMTRTSDGQVQLYDDRGRLLGTIVRPLRADVIGPRAEKVFLARQARRRRATLPVRLP